VSLYAVGQAVEAGHVGGGWRKNDDADLKCAEVPTVCKKCESPWPCAAIARARKTLAADMSPR
jgi:hypothetical protein